MALINGVNPPILNDQEYVDKIFDSFQAVDAHDHTPGKGAPIPTGGLGDEAVTDAKVSAVANISRGKIAAGSTGSVVVNDGTGRLGDSGSMSDGEIVIGQTGGVPVRATLTGTDNQVVVTNGAASITLSTPQSIGESSNVRFGSLTVGGAIAATAVMQADSTTKGFLPPRMTDVQRDAIVTPATGLIVFNTTTNQLNIFNGTSWGAVGGGTFVSNFTGTSITATNDSTQVWRYTGGAAQTLASINVSALSGGSIIEIVGTDSTNTLTVPFSDVLNGFILNGDWVGTQWSVLTLRWDSAAQRFLEVSRNGI